MLDDIVFISCVIIVLTLIGLAIVAMIWPEKALSKVPVRAYKQGYRPSQGPEDH